jgi:hypothetical protein
MIRSAFEWSQAYIGAGQCPGVSRHFTQFFDLGTIEIIEALDTDAAADAFLGDLATTGNRTILLGHPHSMTEDVAYEARYKRLIDRLYALRQAGSRCPTPVSMTTIFNGMWGGSWMPLPCGDFDYWTAISGHLGWVSEGGNLGADNSGHGDTGHSVIIDGNYARITYTGQFTPGRRYKVRWWNKGDAGSRVRYSVYVSDGTTLRSISIKTTSSDIAYGDYTPPTTWRLEERTFYVPAWTDGSVMLRWDNHQAGTPTISLSDIEWTPAG